MNDDTQNLAPQIVIYSYVEHESKICLYIDSIQRVLKMAHPVPSTSKGVIFRDQEIWPLRLPSKSE